jgi:hypothetical protein
MHANSIQENKIETIHVNVRLGISVQFRDHYNKGVNARDWLERMAFAGGRLVR